MDSKYLKLSIIIPAYNAAPYIDKCVRSCECQDIPLHQYEIIIVDDGSVDHTKECVFRLQQEFQNIKYIYQDNACQGAARNNGLRYAKGKYIWYIDADDWINTYILQTIYRKLEKDNLTALLVGHVKLYEEKTIHWHILDGDKICSGREILLSGVIYNSPTYGVWNRHYLLENELFFVEKIYHEDTEIYPRMYINAEKIGFWDKDCYFVYVSKDSTTRGANPQRAIDVITVVRNLLCFFNTLQDAKLKEVLNHYICSTINMSLFNVYQFKKDDIKLLDKAWKNNCDLFNNLINSSIVKYRIEGWLFRLFKYRVSIVYRLLQLFNPTPGIGKIENLD